MPFVNVAKSVLPFFGATQSIAKQAPRFVGVIMKDQISGSRARSASSTEVDPTATQDGRKGFELTDEARKKIEGLCDVQSDAPSEDWFDPRGLDT
jgi:hypothetical protein